MPSPFQSINSRSTKYPVTISAYTPQTNPLVLFALVVGSALVVASILSIGLITGVHILHARRRHRFRTGRNYAIRVHGRPGSVKACAGGDRSKSQSRTNLMKVGGGEDGAGSDWNVAHGYLNDGSHHTTMSASLHAHSFSGQKGGRAAYKPDLAPDAVYGGQNLDDYAVYAVAILEGESVAPGGVGAAGQDEVKINDQLLKQRLSEQISVPV